MKKITIKTPPISVNALYRGRRFMTAEGKDTKESISWEVKSMWKKEPIATPLSIDITFYLTHNRNDLDNLLKGFLDSLTGILWVDDRQIVDIKCSKRIDKKNPRTELTMV